MARPRIDANALPAQFDVAVADTTLIMDGDSACYVIAAQVKTLPTAIRRYQLAVLTQLFMTKAENAVVHLTAMDSQKAGRSNIIAVQEYQGNRKGKPKPPMLEAIRQAVAHEDNWLKEYTVQYHRDIEADDAVIMDSYRLGANGIVSSDDKDLRNTPHAWFDKKTGQVVQGVGFGRLWEEYTEGGNYKAVGLGLKHFWLQMLMGDGADHVKGLLHLNGQQCGASRAFSALNPVHTENDAANFVLDGYRSINQNPLPEGYLLWLLRWRGDNFWNYLQELNLSPANQDFIQDCVRRKWFKIPEVDDDYEWN